MNLAGQPRASAAPDRRRDAHRAGRAAVVAVAGLALALGPSTTGSAAVLPRHDRLLADLTGGHPSQRVASRAPGATAGPSAGPQAGAPAQRRAAGAEQGGVPVGEGATPPVPHVESQPSADEIAAAAEADALRLQVDSQADEVRTAKASAALSAAEASLALQRFTAAEQDRQRVTSAATEHQALLLQAQLDLSERRASLGAWARQAYLDRGTSLASSPSVVTLLSGGDTDDLGVATALLHEVGRGRTRAVEDLHTAELRQQAAAERAGESALAAAAAAREAEQARARRDEALQRQLAALERAEQEYAGTVDAAERAALRARNLQQARVEAARLAAATPAGPGGALGPVGADCAGGDLAGSSNGMLPETALCPVWGAPGALLRADAAFAFGRLSQAYAEHTGRPICVTDSYRSYAGQVAVRAAKPTLAAVPGTSNHGWGTALDLCGGIQSFGTAAHEWMLLNAPAYGWYHPSWARAGGSKPEAWHWEFGG